MGVNVTNAWSVAGAMVRSIPIVRLMPAVFVLAGIVSVNPVPPVVGPFVSVLACSHSPLLLVSVMDVYDTETVIGIAVPVLVRLRIW